MLKRLPILICLLALFGIFSCTTYYIPVESLKTQFAGIDSAKLKLVTVKGPAGDKVQYFANPLSVVKCIDKAGNPFELVNSPSLEIRFTYGLNNKRVIYYFDRIYLTDSCVVGVRSRIIPALRKTIPLNSISKIEIQDGHKNFHYVNR
ncbi:MAG TPA: hypothetical protein PK325_14230 [Cyclobacteriaceae bacterium]|nr:hypothetical protein [Cyclobacteriaceae bacterium]HMV09156.1 hypothetical protein [Cyclobacteriaceae bacterium]HMV91457.1 hypothetical protein [Cyclobacteriaceae bacterium]HMX01475.1 hypothetical protein [Cyclobacteriaceae bacterium]HMX50255.1 hypothetical protein [Cyclobacteriaceae bacterium]